MDIATGDVVRSFRLSHYSAKDSADYPVVDASLSADGRRIAVVDDEGGVVIMDIATGHEVVKLDGPKLVHALAWSPDDRSIATVGASGVIEIWNARTGEIQHELWGQRSYVWAIT